MVTPTPPATKRPKPQVVALPRESDALGASLRGAFAMPDMSDDLRTLLSRLDTATTRH
ncbi:hypothetical protein SAMN05192583_2495 [Sphingomonas gellani]|uniref:Uncharacterized protein n=1 Tax=Sphingomonas gellani TaxID=1166340 RepID=A0A1H8FMU7_9SPHN|nr:hypothetical protein SAMN05192583_2495 [Sphingomonas gellani]